MSLPVSTTLITILRKPDSDDGWPDTAVDPSVVQTGISAVISSPGGVTVRNGSLQAIEGTRLAAEPCDLRHTDQVRDESDQAVYTVEWLHRPVGFGLDHVSAGLRRIEGPPLP